MNIVIGSAFRNSTHRLEGYFKQVAALRDYATSLNGLRVVAVEGDSTDGTKERLRQMADRFKIQCVVHSCNHGQPVFGSTEEPARMAALSKVGNAILDGVEANDDVLVYIESDLIWRADIIWLLCEMVHARQEGFDVLSPMCFAGEAFYDIWAFRKDGQRFSPFPPYHSMLKSSGITQVDSVGSCLVMRREVAEKVRMTNGALVEWCNNACKVGLKIGTLPSTVRIHHP